MGITTISGEIQSQPLNDNFSYLNQKINQMVYNIKDYGALGDGMTDDTASIQAAISAAGTAGGGEVLIPPGNYLANVTISNINNLTICGVGTSSKIVPAIGTGIQVTNCSAFRLDNIQISGGTTGLRIDGAPHSYFDRLYITGQTGDGIFIDGDDSTELFFSKCYINDAAGIGFHYSRTTITDSGGIYLDDIVCVTPTTGTNGFKFASTATSSATAIYLFADKIVADGYTDNAIILNNVANFRISKVYSTTNVSASGSILFKSAIQGIINEVWVQNINANGYDIEISSSCNTIQLDQIEFAGSGTGLGFTGSSMSNVRLSDYVNDAPTFTNDKTRFTLCSITAPRTPFGIYVNGNSNANTCFYIEDVDSATTPKKYFRVSNGTLQIVNNAFSAFPMTLTDAGTLTAAQKVIGISGLGIGNSTAVVSAVGTLTRKMEVFDSAGSTLGFVPIYSSIT